MDEEPTISFAGYTFSASKGCFTCTHVWKDGAAVLLFTHEEDGDLQFMCGAEGHEQDDCVLLHATHILHQQPDLFDLPTVDFGFQAERPSVGQPWVVSKLPEYDDS